MTKLTAHSEDFDLSAYTHVYENIANSIMIEIDNKDRGIYGISLLTCFKLFGLVSQWNHAVFVTMMIQYCKKKQR